jgi:FkbM family methyltransferase
MSKSQLGQDLKVLEFYQNKRNGFFVEVGASDGINISNTYYLETSFDWKGICIEPLPAKYEELVRNRPNAMCCSNAVYNTTGAIVKFDIAHDDSLLSGISANIDKWKMVVDRDKRQIDVETITLEDVLDKYNAPKFIEYLSLDTEGSEYEILRVFPFDKYRFGKIDVEHNYIEPRRTKMRELLESKGYKYKGSNEFDDEYTGIIAQPN